MTDKKTYLTQEGYDKLIKEHSELVKIKRPQVTNRIKEAKDLGDLSENAEYASAREDQSFTEGRIRELEVMLKNAEVITVNNSDPNTVNIGDTVIVEKDGQEAEYTIVGYNEANPAAGKISNESPLGQALLGRKKGEDFTFKTPRGQAAYKVKNIKAVEPA